jgi:hypothetical protein
MKKTLTLFLFSILLLKIGGLVAFLSVERELMREAMFEKINKSQNNNNLTCIIDNKNIDWEEQNKEFWHEGKLYDVVNIEIQNGQKYYYCIADDDETELATVIKNLIGTNDSPLSQTTKNIIGWFFQFVIVPEIGQPVFQNYHFSNPTNSFCLPSRYIFEDWFRAIKPPTTTFVTFYFWPINPF